MEKSSESSDSLSKVNLSSKGFTPAFWLTLLLAIGGALSTYAVLSYRVTSTEVENKAIIEQAKTDRKEIKEQFQKLTDTINDFRVSANTLNNAVLDLKIQLADKDKNFNDLRLKIDNLNKEVMENKIEISILKRTTSVKNP